MAQSSVFFLSDSHFDTSDSDQERAKRRRFANFCERIAGAEHLYVAGDLFDFWFEFRRALPRGYLEILFDLRRLRLSGSRVTLLGGNHDYWLGRVLETELGLELAPDGLVAEHQGRRLRVDHGDEALSGDRGYLALKRVIRNPLFIAAARTLHPDLMFWAADRLSAASRRAEDRAQTQGRRPRKLRLSRVLEPGFDALLFGHLHLAFHYRYQRWDLLCLGDWIRRFTYAELSGGQLRLMDDQGGHYPAQAVEDPDGIPRDRIFPETDAPSREP
jgi:UDP-2,3-diacylglucosamine hydrolase